MFNWQTPLTASWSDRVKGSWWKALVIIALYFIARSIAEFKAIAMGLRASGVKITPENLNQLVTNQEKVMVYLTKVEWFYHGQVALLCLGLVILMMLFKLKVFDFRQLSWRGVGYTVLVFMFFYILQILYGLYLEHFVPEFKEPENQMLIVGMFKHMTPIFLYLTIAIFTPITEELIFRALMMKYTFSLMPVVGALVSSILFALVHGPADVYQFFTYYLLAAGITWVFWRTRRIEYAILFHILQNSLSFIGILASM
ncbi:CPBP family intramembrane glutamic endopeptidase [Vaginisenegalia massiliensis]|uniref:CPBP family intramembrane glutamic endopeptidase n=1 Tax=Vaginisenegalia massiliensis TaxID=2058294 RepID=UPI000F546441|nr:CPBP family intramembrane glutamic endopeptidase [Vaginisenegalia massiliensis]